jgi:apolipoprotein N-acyltransferase
MVLSLPKPDLYPLAWFALIPLLVAIARAATYSEAALAGYAAGFAFFAGTCYWITETMYVYGGLNVAAAVGVAFLFVAVYALFLSAFGAALRFFVTRLGRHGLLLAAPLWVTIELIRSRFFFGGFPWMLSGYALVPYTGVLQMASWTGVYGLSFLATAVSSLFALTVGAGSDRALFGEGKTRGQRPRLQWLGAGVAVIIIAWALPAQRDTEQDAKLDVRIVQTNIPLDQPWQKPYSDQLLDQLQTFSTRKGAGLIVWPETPAPFYLAEDPALRAHIQRIAVDSGSYVLMGYVGTAGESVANSAALIDPHGDIVSRYDKMHLVPFGEYVPLKRLLFFAQKLVQQVGDFTPGSAFTVSSLGSRKLSTVICYESIFPELVREFVSRGAELIVVITDDGWFGKSSAPFQHLRMGAVRAVENRRWVVRSANTGISAIIDPYGRIVAQTRIGERAVLDGVVQYRSERTFYTEHGDVFAYLNVAAVILLWASLQQRRKTKWTKN